MMRSYTKSLFKEDLNNWIRIRVIEESDGSRYLTMDYIHCWDCLCGYDDTEDFCVEKGVTFSVSTALAVMEAISEGLGIRKQIIKLPGENSVTLEGCHKALGIICKNTSIERKDFFLSPNELSYFKSCFDEIKDLLICKNI